MKTIFLLAAFLTGYFAMEEGQKSSLAVFDRHGVIIVPTYGRRIGNSDQYVILASGRISTSIEEPENIRVIDETGYLRIPEFHSKRMNFRLRKDFFHTTALSSVSVPLKLEGVESFLPIDVKSGANGTFHVRTVITMPPNSTTEVIKVSLKDVHLKNNIYLAEDEGFSIISDIDDTIKVTKVLSKLKAMAYTFLFPFISTEGMPIFYRDLQRDLTIKTSKGFVSKPTFHYLSGTPYQFVGSIQPFLERVYPPGEIISQTFSVDSGGFQAFTDVKPYKIRGARSITDFFENRRFVLIGDSTQFDPEVYAQIALENPDKIVCIFIRVVSGDNLKKELVQNANSRFENAFTGIPSEKWSLFKTPNDLPSTKQIAKGICRK